MTDAPTTSWSDIRDRLDDLRLYANELKAETPDAADFIPGFAGEADEILEAAAGVSTSALENAHKMIDEILIELGYLPRADRKP